MKYKIQTALVFLLALVIIGIWVIGPAVEKPVGAQEAAEAKATPQPTPAFDQAAALAKLREQIKGREQEPAETVFKSIQNFKGVPAGRILAIMERGYSRSLGTDCTHCHTPDNWAAETKPTKQIAREMQLMAIRISGELLPGIEGLKDRRMAVNCTTCHRGEVKPATSLPAK